VRQTTTVLAVIASWLGFIYSGGAAALRARRTSSFVVFFVHVLEDEARKERPNLLLLAGEQDWRGGGALAHAGRGADARTTERPSAALSPPPRLLRASAAITDQLRFLGLRSRKLEAANADCFRFSAVEGGFPCFLQSAILFAAFALSFCTGSGGIRQGKKCHFEAEELVGWCHFLMVAVRRRTTFEARFRTESSGGGPDGASPSNSPECVGAL
jgi:hypothetical protein